MAHSKVKVEDKDLGWIEIAKRAKQIHDWRVKVGVLADDAKGGLHVEGGKLSVAEIAAVLEFGTQDGRIPARPFVTSTFDKNREELKKMGAELIEKALLGHMSVEHALGLIGAKLAADIKATVVAGVPPPNAPSTALAKAMKGKTKSLFMTPGRKAKQTVTTNWMGMVSGVITNQQAQKPQRKEAKTLGDAFAQAGAIAAVKPLIDTGRMLNAITWAVVKDNKGEK